MRVRSDIDRVPGIACDIVPPHAERVYTLPLSKEAVVTAVYVMPSWRQRAYRKIFGKWPLAITFDVVYGQDGGKNAVLTVKNRRRYAQSIDARVSSLPDGTGVSFMPYWHPSVELRSFR